MTQYLWAAIASHLVGYFDALEGYEQVKDEDPEVHGLESGWIRFIAPPGIPHSFCFYVVS